MRTESSQTRYFDFSGGSSLKVAREYRAKYEAISQLLDANPELLTLAHRDWARWLYLRATLAGSGRDVFGGCELPESGYSDRPQCVFTVFCPPGDQAHHGFHLSEQGHGRLVGPERGGDEPGALGLCGSGRKNQQRETAHGHHGL